MRALLFLLFVSVSVSLVLSDTTISERQNKKTSVQTKWSQADSKAYARDMLSKWQDNEWKCLSKLWGKESAWNPKAYNKIKVMGRNAGGIPQLLGLSIDTPPTRQIERGLSYIYYRYDTPCNAWRHFERNNWH
jgi:hypothetical protein